MTPTRFAFLSTFLKERSGLTIGPEKLYLVESRLQPIARAKGFAGLDELADALARGGDLGLVESVVEAMTTNETFFFRDATPFRLFTDIALPALMQARAAQKRIRIWSAACSTGQEPYSLAMLLDDRAALLQGWTVDIVATDLSTKVIERARAGVFSHFEVQRGLPVGMMLKHFTQDGETWRISDKMRQKVQFRTLNLLRDFSALGRFDLVFCRNVLIYFDDAGKIDVLGRLARQMPEDAVLMLGAAETVRGSTSFRPDARAAGLFARVEDRAAGLQPMLSMAGARA